VKVHQEIKVVLDFLTIFWRGIKLTQGKNLKMLPRRGAEQTKKHQGILKRIRIGYALQ